MRRVADERERTLFGSSYTLKAQRQDALITSNPRRWACISTTLIVDIGIRHALLLVCNLPNWTDMILLWGLFSLQSFNSKADSHQGRVRTIIPTQYIVHVSSDPLTVNGVPASFDLYFIE